MNTFVPTWLYVKVHKVTGLKYLGKTIHDPATYKGSGVYWNKHLEKHGNDVETTWSHLYTDPKILNEEALFFSKVFEIVSSSEWANLTEETGFTGGNLYDQSSSERRMIMKERTLGKKMPEGFSEKKRQERLGAIVSDDTKKKISKKLLGVKKPNGHGEKISAALTGVEKTEAHKLKISKTLKNKPLITCPHCNKTGGSGMLSWHFDNCRKK